MRGDEGLLCLHPRDQIRLTIAASTHTDTHLQDGALFFFKILISLITNVTSAGVSALAL